MMYKISKLDEDPTPIIEFLKDHGWVALKIDDSNLFQRVNHWETCFQNLFNLDSKSKKVAGKYRLVEDQGIMVGYRHDSEREFIECHMKTSGRASPSFNKISDYQSTVKALYEVLSISSSKILIEISKYMGWNPEKLLYLTDLPWMGQLPYLNLNRLDLTCSNRESDCNVDDVVDDEDNERYSTSVLRICKYNSLYDINEDNLASSESCKLDSNVEPPNNASYDFPSPIVQFGAHTDTSFLTLGLCSSNPGLEIFDMVENDWIPSEAGCVYGQEETKDILCIFVGEYLQILTRQIFKAAIHRVVSPRSNSRISCPFIIRGRDEAIINFSDLSSAVADPVVPGLDGTRMGDIHKMLDIKRSKCFRLHANVKEDWVLTSYPVDSDKFPGQII